MSTELIMVLLLGAVILVVVVLAGQMRNRKLADDGKIVIRDGSFIESAETFTLSGADFPTLISALKAVDFSDSSASWESKGATQTVYFKSSHGWTAQLQALESDAGTNKYKFFFTRWQTRKGIPWRADTMNMLLTSVEKVFLSLDSNTQVETIRLKTKSKLNFF